MTAWLAYCIGAIVGCIFSFGYLAVHAPNASGPKGACFFFGFSAAFGCLAVITFVEVTR